MYNFKQTSSSFFFFFFCYHVHVLQIFQSNKVTVTFTVTFTSALKITALKVKKFLMVGDIKCQTVEEPPNCAEQWSRSWTHKSGQTSPMSGGGTPPLPMGAYRNGRSRKAEKILSSPRYLAVTWHRSKG